MYLAMVTVLTETCHTNSADERKCCGSASKKKTSTRTLKKNGEIGLKDEITNY
jgi:hypothetical protein